jgi:hypothetical protein
MQPLIVLMQIGGRVAARRVVPGTSHGLLVEKPELCNLLITEFLTSDPAPTLAPIRRATPTAS